MRLHRDGYLQARSLEIPLPAGVVRRAKQSSKFLTQGVQNAVEAYLGVRIEGAQRVRCEESFEFLDTKVIIESDWAVPSRR